MQTSQAIDRARYSGSSVEAISDGKDVITKSSHKRLQTSILILALLLGFFLLILLVGPKDFSSKNPSHALWSSMNSNEIRPANLGVPKYLMDQVKLKQVSNERKGNVVKYRVLLDEYNEY